MKDVMNELKQWQSKKERIKLILLSIGFIIFSILYFFNPNF